jgi:glutamate racemase
MIGVFDSGIGGLTLLAALRKELPNENFVYYADTDNVPYSYKTPDEIRGYVEDAFLFLCNKGCKAVVLACNTATNVAVEYLRQKYIFPIIAIQPAVKVARDNGSPEKRILVCATPITLASERFNNLAKSLNVSHLIDKLPLPKLVEFAEKENFRSPEVIEYLKEEFGKFSVADHEYVVLGCTHFTFFEDLIAELFPNLTPIDGNAGTARHLKNTLYHLQLLKGKEEGSVVFYESGRGVENNARFVRLLNALHN